MKTKNNMKKKKKKGKKTRKPGTNSENRTKNQLRKNPAQTVKKLNRRGKNERIPTVIFFGTGTFLL